MELEKNKATRELFRHVLRLSDRILGMPFPKMKRVKQITYSHCGPAVLEELFSFLGKKISQKSVVKTLHAEAKIKKSGLNVADLAKAANALGGKEFAFWSKKNSKISDLDKIINKFEYPVGVEWQGIFYEDEDEDSGHYAVITKINPKTNYIRICDSYARFAGVDRRFALKDFTKRWWDVNFIKGRNITDKKMMFIITPKDSTWPKKLGMKRM